MQVTPLGILSPSSDVMRSERYVRERAIRLRKVQKTMLEKDGKSIEARKPATALIGLVLDEVNDWTEAGNQFLTPYGDHLIMERSLDWRDIYVAPANGGPVFKKLPYFKLQEPAVAFKEDGKRTMNRILAKADADIKTALDIRLLSAVYWIAAYFAIQDHRAE